MVKFFSSSYAFDEPWSVVTLAFFLRYPNPYAAHVLSCDVLSRHFSSDGNLITKRLILKQGNVPKWLPRGLVSRAESWIVEESEVDAVGRTTRCETTNLDHKRLMSVREMVTIAPGMSPGQTVQLTEANVRSDFGWGLARRIERYGYEKFQRNLQRSRDGISLILSLLHQARVRSLAFAGEEYSLPPLSVQGTIFDSYRPRIIGGPNSSNRAASGDSDPDHTKKPSSPSTLWRHYGSSLRGSFFTTSRDASNSTAS